MLRFHKGYFLLAAVIFITEVCIAVFLHDRIVRPYIGDVLVVVLIYCFVRTFFNFSKAAVAIGVLLFAFMVEFAQAFLLVNKLGLGHSRIARIILGTSFSWTDMLTYIAGIAIVSGVEYYRERKKFQP
ncbi:DUF2809 domain-containing protein [Taibaiella lutea]|uniref:DUF2809 domain-containing protein n=1 Tax=Taibaiella lutea TaxID=2608001 RepID=A0A5M6CPU5_9BACT|nr:DUF2809 domain-containing protein [Taibaiella lutea]KAA5537281.1 DUF2809 domain-containing protein [Taibaiella lutea]